jgi:hypothetical protein
MEELQAIEVTRKTGNEAFAHNGVPLPFNLMSFWRWSSSDLVGNALRGMLAEFIVASAVDCTANTRKEWDAFDLETPEGIKIEVKSGAYLQSWHQENLSSIQFNIQPTLGWNATSNTYATKRERQSDVYVFSVLSHKNKETVDPLNLDQWEFYVISTEALNRAVGDQKTIGLSSLKQLGPIEATYESIGSTIKRVLGLSS